MNEEEEAYSSDESEADFGEIGSDIRNGHIMCDLFDQARKGVSFSERFTNAIKDASFLMKFSSPVIADFFNDATECLIKRKVRQFLKLLAAYWCVILIKSLRYPEESMTTFKFSLVILLGLIFLYLATFRNLSRMEYEAFSLGATILSLTYTIYESARSESAVDGAFGYSFSLIIMLIIFLPIAIQVIIPVIILFCTIFLITSSRKMTYTQIKRNVYMTNLQPLDSQISSYSFNVYDDGIMTWSFLQKNYIMIQLTSWITVIVIGCYLRFWNDLRRRSAFSIIGKSVKARKHSLKALEEQSEWITAIMPIQVRDQYMEKRRLKMISGSIWVFSTAFDEVSILFADIVGFTKMSSSKTATTIVMLLNDLYNRFDDLSNHVNCEKIGTLGDCYYAVAGCPVERSDHAECCVELGLGMCRIIKAFNQDNGEEVNMRVGVHTGRVNAAIIGNNRFRYDVYSTDVIVANQMETYGLPGRVHISQTTYKLVKPIFRFARGEDLTIHVEEKVGIAGMELKEAKMHTYFVDPLSSKIRKHGETYGQNLTSNRVLTIKDNPDNDLDTFRGSSQISFDLTSSITKGDSPFSRPTRNRWSFETERKTSLFIGSDAKLYSDAEKWRKMNEKDIRLIEDLQDDPMEQVKLFSSMPLKPLVHQFKNAEIEADFKRYMEGYVPIVTVDSPKLSPFFDAIAIAAINIAICVQIMMHTGSEQSDNLDAEVITSVLILFSTITFCVLFLWGTTLHSSENDNYNSKVYLFFSNSIVREIMLAITTISPAFVTFFRTDMSDIINSREASKRVAHFEFGMLRILIHSMATSSFAWSRGICIVVNGILMMLNLYALKTRFDNTYCEPQLWYHNLDNPVEGFHERMAAVLTIMAVTYFITVENERSLRLWYYVSREAEISCTQAIKENESAQQLLDNVIPRYVFQQLAYSGHKHLKAGTFCFAMSMPNVAVTFACITNFFSAYYREDYKGGEGSLKLLNTIICSFDDLMSRSEFASVEKIKTINDCYMVAAGLNKLQRNMDPTGIKHAFELMEYCFALYKTLEEVNEKYIIGTDKFLMKIGYYIGDVTAGIIGSRKPMYDIWGNTVNVSSRMYSTGTHGKIQVPEDVKLILKDNYNFEYRGVVFVKGKGDMKTYFCNKINLYL